jgi:hypothetical protein
MPENDRTKPALRWGWVSIALLVIGLLIATSSGLCVGWAAYDLYAGGIEGSFAGVIFVISGLVFLVGLGLIYGGFETRKDPEDD